MIGLMSREFRDHTRCKGSQNAVATTWLVSFDQIRKTNSLAAGLLSFISHIEPKAIPQSMLPCADSKQQMLDAIGVLCSYDFLTRRGDSKIFDMHSHIHLATRILVKQHGLQAQESENAIRHLAKIFPSHYYANRAL